MGREALGNDWASPGAACGRGLEVPAPRKTFQREGLNGALMDGGTAEGMSLAARRRGIWVHGIPAGGTISAVLKEGA